MGVLLYPRVLLQRHAPWVIVAVIMLGGCAVKLAPDFDRTIVDGLTQANENAMTLFASVSSGLHLLRSRNANPITMH
jgi:hypothetical protein